MSKADLEEKIELAKIAARKAFSALDLTAWGAANGEAHDLQQLMDRRFPPQPLNKDRAAKTRVSEAAIREWLTQRVDRHNSLSPYPSEEQDLKDIARDLNATIPRDKFRELRKEMVPREWIRPGRKRKATH